MKVSEGRLWYEADEINALLRTAIIACRKVRHPENSAASIAGFVEARLKALENAYRHPASRREKEVTMLQQQSHEEPASVPEVQRPTVGRIVHYVLAEGDAPNPGSVGEIRPAIVTGALEHPAGSYLVGLCIFTEEAVDGAFDTGPVISRTNVPHYDPPRTVGDPTTYDTGTWHWPPRS